MLTNPKTEDGWKQIRAALGLITWSGLADWEPRGLRFVAAPENIFEQHAATMDPKFGRLICWINFGVGTEYMVRGAFMLVGHGPIKAKQVLQPPAQGTNLQQWIADANACDPAVYANENESCLKFGSSLPWDKLLAPGPDLELAKASVKLLAVKIRNRDAHRYTENTRAFHFHAVGDLFVPALNAILGSVDQSRLRSESEPTAEAAS